MAATARRQSDSTSWTRTVLENLPEQRRTTQPEDTRPAYPAYRDLTEDVREAAARRVLDFYLRTTHTAAGLLDPHSVALPLDPPVPGSVTHPLPDYLAALAWVDTEYPNLMAALHAAGAQARHRTVCLLDGALLGFHYLWGLRRDRLTTWRAALHAAAHLPSADTNTHWLLSVGYADLGHYEEAIQCLQQALVSAERHHNLTDQAHTRYQLAQAWGRHGEHQQALDYATRAASLYRALDRPVWQGRALAEAGWYAARLGQYDTADAHLRAALALYRRHPDPLARRPS